MSLAVSSTWQRWLKAFEVYRDRRQRLVERIDLVQRLDLGLVGEKDVDLVADQRPELLAIAVDAERVRQRDRNLASGGVRGVEGL